MAGANGPRILLGVSGSIAAYKAVEIARLLIKRGAQVQVALTKGGAAFVTPLTFEAITGRPVLTDVLMIGGSSSEIRHVEEAHRIDLLLIAPASANLIARLAVGMADDALTATALATKAPIVIAPAMETGMWDNPATQANVVTLEARGATVLGPDEGGLASGRSGRGRMLEPDAIVGAALGVLPPGDLEGAHLIITAGPTWEPLDPVRVLTNRSTGAMGIELARAAARRGAHVVLVLGPTHLSPPEHPHLRTVRVETAEEMLQAGRRALRPDAIVIGTAAVSDFRPASPRSKKLKRSDPAASKLELSENPDVLADLGKRLGKKGLLIGFAAETDDVEKNARDKLKKKGCNMVIANRVGKDAGFGAGLTSVLAVGKSGKAVPFGPAEKSAVADFVLDRVAELRSAGSKLSARSRTSNGPRRRRGHRAGVFH